MHPKQSIQSLINAAQSAGSMISETSETIMVSTIGATQWDAAPRLMIFADNTAVIINPDNTRRTLRTVKAMKSAIGMANA